MSPYGGVRGLRPDFYTSKADCPFQGQKRPKNQKLMRSCKKNWIFRAKKGQKIENWCDPAKKTEFLAGCYYMCIYVLIKVVLNKNVIRNTQKKIFLKIGPAMGFEPTHIWVKHNVHASLKFGYRKKKRVPQGRFEPRTFGFKGGRLIHWAMLLYWQKHQNGYSK